MLLAVKTVVTPVRGVAEGGTGHPGGTSVSSPDSWLHEGARFEKTD